MPEFLNGVNLVYVVGIISGVVAGIWAFYRFVYEKKLERFKEASTNVFSDDEDQVLAAVANLGVFKRDFFFERNTIDVLLTRLYKELNYNITNAITNALMQFSNRRELLYIAGEILGINRNFFFQTRPYKDMLVDINFQYERIKKIKDNNLTDIYQLKEIEKETAIIDKRMERYGSEFMRLNEKVSYELLWHKQITADTYARIIRRAGALKIPASVIFLNYLKQILLSWDFHFYGRRIPLNIYQNAFAYVHLVQFKTTTCSILRSGIENATIADITFNNIHDIYDSVFNKSSFNDCIFNKGVIRQTLMLSINFLNTHFNKIDFRDVFFMNTNFTNCSFSECTGLLPEHFVGALIDGKTVLPGNISRQAIQDTKDIQVIRLVYDSYLREGDKGEIFDLHAPMIKKVETIYEIQISRLDNASKDKIISGAAANFRLTSAYSAVLELPCDNDMKWDLLYRLFSAKPLETLMVELYDTNLPDDTLKNFLLTVKRGQSLQQFLDAVNAGELHAKEKLLMIGKLNALFDEAAANTPGQAEEPAANAGQDNNS